MTQRLPERAPSEAQDSPKTAPRAPNETQRVVYLVSFLILKGFHQCDLPGVVLTCHESITELDQILNLDSNSQC